MNPSDLVQFRGTTVEEVFQKVHQALGPDAVVVQLKRVTANGVSRIWGGVEIEALARVEQQRPRVPVPPPRSVVGGEVDPASVLRSWGLSPATIQLVLGQVAGAHVGVRTGTGPVRATAGLLAAWDRLAKSLPADPRRIVLVGPPGVGKSTAIAKWLTIEALKHQRSCRVWRLDGATLNGAEALALHADLLGIPVETAWNPSLPRIDFEVLDLPGWSASDRELSDRMANLIDRFEPDLTALVLNLAYEFEILQVLAGRFQPLRPAGLVLTHLDEAPSPARVWDLVVQGGLPLVATSSGPWVPGGFDRISGEAWVERLLGAL